MSRISLAVACVLALSLCPSLSAESPGASTSAEPIEVEFAIDFPDDRPGRLWVSEGWMLNWKIYSETIDASPIDGGGPTVSLDISRLVVSEGSVRGMPYVAGRIRNGFFSSGIYTNDEGKKTPGLLLFDANGSMTAIHTPNMIIYALVQLPDDRGFVAWWQGPRLLNEANELELVEACSLLNQNLEETKYIVPPRVVDRYSMRPFSARRDYAFDIRMISSDIFVLDPYENRALRVDDGGTVLAAVSIQSLPTSTVVQGWNPSEQAVDFLLIDLSAPDVQHTPSLKAGSQPGQGNSTLVRFFWTGKKVFERPVDNVTFLYPGANAHSFLLKGGGSRLEQISIAPTGTLDE